MPYDTFPIIVARAPNATPTTFTDLAELDVVNLPELGVNEADASIQNALADKYVTSTLLRRKPVTISLNFRPDSGTQDHLTGLYKAVTTQSFDGYKFTHSSSSLVWVASGFCTNLKPKTPKEGVFGLDATLRFSGTMTINGVVVGS